MWQKSWVKFLGMIVLVAGCQSARGEATAVSTPVSVTPTAEIGPLATLPTDTPQLPTQEPLVATAANADVLDVKAVQTADGSWTFTVTVFHPDMGWEDYADGWDVVLPDGTIVKPDPDSPFTRLLLHPHETEQPFTRSQSGLLISADVNQVRVRAHDLVDGFGGKEVVVDLTADSGPGFTVQK